MIEQALKENPENGAFLDSLGWVYFKLGDFRKARFYVEKALQFEGSSATLYYHLGDIYEKLNMSKKAVQYWKRALEMEDISAKETSEIYRKLQNTK